MVVFGVNKQRLVRSAIIGGTLGKLERIEIKAAAAAARPATKAEDACR